MEEKLKNFWELVKANRRKITGYIVAAVGMYIGASLVINSNEADESADEEPAEE